MLELFSLSPVSTAHTLVDRARKVACALGGPEVWVRASGPYLLLGLPSGDAFARLTSLGGSLYSLAFRTITEAGRPGLTTMWDPVLLIDELPEVVELALVGAGVLPADA